MLTQTGTGSVLEIDPGTGIWENAGAPGDTLIHTYAEAGIYTACSRIDGGEISSIEVTVVDVNLHGPVACQVGFMRDLDVFVTPVSAKESVSYSENDPRILHVEFNEYTDEGTALKLVPYTRGTPVLIARLGSTGPIVSTQEIDEFTIYCPAKDKIEIDPETRIGTTLLMIKPYIPDLDFRLYMFASQSTFAGGTKELLKNTSSDFKQIFNPEQGETWGGLDFDVEVPEGENIYCFSVIIKQKEKQVGDEGMVNGNAKDKEAEIDLDVDSDNTKGYEEPERDAYEDSIEDNISLPGKLICKNDCNVDGATDDTGAVDEKPGTYIPNYADGYDKYDYEDNAGGKFTAIVLEIKEPIEIAKAKVIIGYNGSDPDNVSRSGSGTVADPHDYAPTDSGHLRLWKKDGPSKRLKASVPAGDFIKPWHMYNASDLGFNGGRTKTFYMEGIKISNSIQEHPGFAAWVISPQGFFIDIAYVTVVDVDIQPDTGERGISGDIVESIGGPEGEKHYVSPKKQNDSIEFKSEVSPTGLDFESYFEWDGQDIIYITEPTKIAIFRDNTKKSEVTVKLKHTTSFKPVCGKMNVWIVWAAMNRIRVKNATVGHGLVKPRVGAIQAGSWVESEWRFVATIQIEDILDKATDIPNLTGPDTRPVPGASTRHVTSGDLLAGGANKRWDISRQYRVRMKSPTVSTNDYDDPGGIIYDGLPNANNIVMNYPNEDAEGNDDRAPGDEDNNPYSNAELQPGTSNKTPKGKLASHDPPTLPLFRDAAGTVGDTVEAHMHCREFVRLQIGDSGAGGYKNWYRISSFADGEWRHVGKLKKQSATWIDNGSTTEENNNNWQKGENNEEEIKMQYCDYGICNFLVKCICGGQFRSKYHGQGSEITSE